MGGKSIWDQSTNYDQGAAAAKSGNTMDPFFNGHLPGYMPGYINTQNAMTAAAANQPVSPPAYNYGNMTTLTMMEQARLAHEAQMAAQAGWYVGGYPPVGGGGAPAAPARPYKPPFLSRLIAGIGGSLSAMLGLVVLISLTAGAAWFASTLSGSDFQIVAVVVALGFGYWTLQEIKEHPLALLLLVGVGAWFISPYSPLPFLLSLV